MNDTRQPQTLRLERIDAMRCVDQEAWDALLPEPASPFMTWTWLASLEDAGLLTRDTGWLPMHVLIWQGDTLVGAMPMYSKTHSFGEFVYDFSWANLADRLDEPYYPKLVVTSPFAPVASARILALPTLPLAERLAIQAALVDHALSLVDGRHFHSVPLLFVPVEDVQHLAPRGMLHRVSHQYHWQNQGYADFDAYLERFRSKRRKEIRRERKMLRELGITVRTVAGTEIQRHELDLVYDFYADTCAQYMGGGQYLSREFFHLLHERQPHLIRLFLAERADGEIIAGTFNIETADRLYGRYWGSSEQVPFLHFETCYYAMIEYACQAGISTIEPGAGGDHKYARGFDPVETWSLHHVFSPRMRFILERHLERERAQVEHIIDHLIENSALKATVTEE
jgi:uncharacterized protein